MPREVSLRPATAGDASAVAEVLLSSRRAFQPYACLRTDEDIHGWVRSVLIPTGGATAREAGVSWITQLFISPAHVDQSIGTLLLSHARATLPVPVRLWCFQRNVRARRFYERHGFQAIHFTDGRANEERLPDVLYERAS